MRVISAHTTAGGSSGNDARECSSMPAVIYRLIKRHDKINNQTQIDPMFAAVPNRTDVAATRFARPYMFANK